MKNKKQGFTMVELLGTVAILAIVLGAINIRKSGNKLGKAGMITGIIGTSLCAFVYITMVIIIMGEIEL